MLTIVEKFSVRNSDVLTTHHPAASFILILSLLREWLLWDWTKHHVNSTVSNSRQFLLAVSIYKFLGKMKIPLLILIAKLQEIINDCPFRPQVVSARVSLESSAMI